MRDDHTPILSQKGVFAMTEIQNAAIAAIEAQQPPQRNAIWMVGEQLKDICRQEPDCAQLIAEDLKSEAMAIAKAEKKIAERAQKNRQGNCGIVTPAEADEILRAFYGLPMGTGVAPSSVSALPSQSAPGHFEDFAASATGSAKSSHPEGEPRQPAAAGPSGTPVPTKYNTETKILDIFDFL
jgi:hypothetical protein